MKLSPDFLTYESKGQHYLVASGGASFNGIVNLNETAAFITDMLKDGSDADLISSALSANYPDEDEAKIKADVEGVIGKLRGIGAVID